MIDNGPNAASASDIRVLSDSLAYVLSRASGFLLDADDPGNFDFPAYYVVLNFDKPPSIARSAALFRTVGQIDPDLFSTDTSGYTQFGRAYLSLQSAVSEERFVAGYVQAALLFKVEYTPIVPGVPSLFVGGAAFPGNDWTVNTRGDEYLGRIPPESHRALAQIRAFHLRATQDVLGRLAPTAERCCRDLEEPRGVVGAPRKACSPASGATCGSRANTGPARPLPILLPAVAGEDRLRSGSSKRLSA